MPSFIDRGDPLDERIVTGFTVFLFAWLATSELIALAGFMAQLGRETGQW